MPRASQVRFVKESLRTLIETLFVTKQINRPTRLAYERILRDRRLMEYFATHLYGPERESAIPGDPDRKLVLLSLREIGRKQFNLLVFKRTSGATPRKRAIRCLVGHRFTREIEERFRWNLRELFGLFGVEEEYSGFDGAAINIIDDLRNKIATCDFCLFDNRETTSPYKPNVYIEAGMAFALDRPFIFCHYRREVWPSDFSNVFYISYRNYKELFQKLYARLPIFLENKVTSPGRRTGPASPPVRA